MWVAKDYIVIFDTDATWINIIDIFKQQEWFDNYYLIYISSWTVEHLIM